MKILHTKHCGFKDTKIVLTIFFVLEYFSKTFLVRAPDSRNAGAASGGSASSFGEHASMGKVTYNYDGSKEPQ